MSLGVAIPDPRSRWRGPPATPRSPLQAPESIRFRRHPASPSPEGRIVPSTARRTRRGIEVGAGEEPVGSYRPRDGLPRSHPAAPSPPARRTPRPRHRPPVRPRPPFEAAPRSDRIEVMIQAAAPKAPNFIRQLVAEDTRTGRFGHRVVTRFPPEPNGYLHIGHAKAISLDFGIAQEFGGRCHLRFDDTNPTKESQEYVDSIKGDVRWLGFDWGEHLYYASDHFEQLYAWAVQLITAGKAYVDDLTPEQLREYRGTLTEPGRESPFRTRSIEENLDLFARMRAAEFDEGTRTLRAKIDMASGNLNLRDPVMYRIRKATHHRTGDTWCIYPTYDWAHGQSDSIEGVTHSLCTLEYEDHRPLYDWYLDALGIYHPRQIEFARLNVSHTIMSKRKLLELVQQGLVSGWDDPRMPTLAGLRRRGYTPEAIRDFAERVGTAKSAKVLDIAFLEHCLREDLNRRPERRMAVLRPLKLVTESC